MTHRLFVYGSLAPGKPNARVLEDVPGTWQPASLRGRLLAEGWGAAMGFPGLVLSDAGAVVHGLVFTSDALPAHWARLDAFEGEGYVRQRARVQLASGESVEADVYTLRNPPSGLPT